MSLRRVAAPLVLLASVLLGACGASTASAPKTETPDARTSRTQKREDPVLIAPPPAYGNKIVMAERATTTTRF